MPEETLLRQYWRELRRRAINEENRSRWKKSRRKYYENNEIAPVFIERMRENVENVTTYKFYNRPTEERRIIFPHIHSNKDHWTSQSNKDHRYLAKNSEYYFKFMC